MKVTTLRRIIFMGTLILAGLSGGLTGCKKREEAEESRPYEQQLSIEGELQWESGLDWTYIPQDRDGENGKIGCFVPETASGEQIEVYHRTLSEEDFFVMTGSYARELQEKYPEEGINYRINGSTEIDQFVQLDTENEHRLYIRYQDSVYILSSEVEKKAWQDFLTKWLFHVDLKWDGLAVIIPEGSVSDADTKYKGIKTTLHWGEDSIFVDGDILLFHRQEDGYYFKRSFKNEEEDRIEEVILRPADISLEYDSWEDALSFFRDRYPDMYSLEGYFHDKNSLRNAEVRAHDHILYEERGTEGSHGFFLWNGNVCEVFSWGYGSYYDMVHNMRRIEDYHLEPCFIWEKEEDGSIVYSDNVQGNFFRMTDLGDGNVIRLQAKIVDKIEEEENGSYIYDVKIFDEKGEQLLQEIQADSVYAHRSPFVFEDFNADGYLDLTVQYFYGVNGGSASHYIFSPSKKEFMKLDSELDYYSTYSVDYETRRLEMHYHGSVITGSEITYQWKNEMDYEMIKLFNHIWLRDGDVQVNISRYENGKEEILSDFVYSDEEYSERHDIWGTYYEDFIWEKEVTDRTTGKKYTLRYAEVFLPEEAEKNLGPNYGIYYDGRIYVYDEDTYLVSVTHSEIIFKSSSLEWEDGDGEKEQALIINYVDGGRSGYYLSGLVIPDYQE